MITVQLSGNITITGLSKEVCEAIRTKFALPNAAYLSAIKRKSPGIHFIPRFIHYAKVDKYEDKYRLTVPRGLAVYVERLLDGKTYNWDEYVVENEYKFDRAEIVLRDYQERVVDDVWRKLHAKNHERSGLIEMGTGGGKTICALKLVQMFKLTATVLVPNNVLLKQWVEEIRKFLRAEPGEMGGGIKSVGPITVATWQSAAIKSPLDLIGNTSVLIVDEVHGCVSPIRRRTLEKFKAKYIIGLTATNDRTDGQGLGVNYLIGHTLATHKETELKPTIEIVFSRVDLPLHSDYHKMVEAMVEHESRNKLIVGLVLGEMLQGKKILVLTKRIEHYKKLEKMLPFGTTGLHFIDSSDPERHDILAGFKTGARGYNAIFGTTSLLSVGWDLPSLDTLIIACDIKSSVLTTQSVGRVLRLFEGKKQPKIIDIADHKNPIFASQFRARQRLYIDKGWMEPPVYHKK